MKLVSMSFREADSLTGFIEFNKIERGDIQAITQGLADTGRGSKEDVYTLFYWTLEKEKPSTHRSTMNSDDHWTCNYNDWD